MNVIRKNNGFYHMRVINVWNSAKKENINKHIQNKEKDAKDVHQKSNKSSMRIKLVAFVKMDQMIKLIVKKRNRKNQINFTFH